MQQKNIIILAVVVVIALLALVIFVVFPDIFKSGTRLETEVKKEEKPKIIEEKLVIPETENISGAEGRTVEKGSVDVPLVPKSEGEKVIVSKAVLTVKGAYDLASIEAQKWSVDAKLVFIKSLGAVTLEGKSSQWQLVFSSASAKATADKSKTTQKGYEVIIQADQIVSKKEVDSTAVGADVPENFSDRDAGWAVEQLAANPQFQTASMSAITFVYNYDAKAWDYVIANSFGKSAVRVR